jgi:hypothetical protein
MCAGVLLAMAQHEHWLEAYEIIKVSRLDLHVI